MIHQEIYSGLSGGRQSGTLVVPPIGVRRRSNKTKWPWLLRSVATLLAISFALYAILGKGFAYAGYRPIYVGELLLCSGFIALIATRRLGTLMNRPFGVLLIIFSLWQAACSVPYVNEYGLDTFRDAVTWGYAGFAWIVAALVLRLNGALEEVITRFRRFAKWFVFFGPVCFLLSIYLHSALPVWPGTSITIPFVKSDDLLVHLGGIWAFIASGFAVGSQWISLPLVGGAAILAVTGRGALLGFIAAVIVSACVLRQFKRLVPIVVGIVLVSILVIEFDPHVSMPGSDREISLNQLFRNLLSVGGDAEGSLEGTKEWRLAWWNKILDSTLYGPYFWTGRGYGINLADDDGFQTNGELHDLRSPHNSHLTFLARSGVPGFLLWAAVQLGWAFQMYSDFSIARRRGRQHWASLFAFLIPYWAAFMVAATFDVMFEGPTSAIPFWIVVGTGWGAHILFRQSLSRSGETPFTSQA